MRSAAVWAGMQPAAMASADKVHIFCQHLIWPLACEEGRALAEAFYGPEVIAALDRDRYDNPRGYLHTYWRSGDLHWISLTYCTGLGLCTAINFPIQRPGRIKEDSTKVSTLMRIEDALKRPPGSATDWRIWFAGALDMPTLRHWAFTGDGWQG